MTAVGALGVQVFSRFFIQEVTLVESPSLSTLLSLPLCKRVALTLRQVVVTMFLAHEGIRVLGQHRGRDSHRYSDPDVMSAMHPRCLLVVLVPHWRRNCAESSGAEYTESIPPFPTKYTECQ